MRVFFTRSQRKRGVEPVVNNDGHLIETLTHLKYQSHKKDNVIRGMRITLTGEGGGSPYQRTGVTFSGKGWKDGLCHTLLGKLVFREERFRSKEKRNCRGFRTPVTRPWTPGLTCSSDLRLKRGTVTPFRFDLVTRGYDHYERTIRRERIPGVLHTSVQPYSWDLSEISTFIVIGVSVFTVSQRQRTLFSQRIVLLPLWNPIRFSLSKQRTS